MIFNRVHLVFCLFERNRQSPYPMALAAAYLSIRQRTTAPLTLQSLLMNRLLSARGVGCAAA